MGVDIMSEDSLSPGFPTAIQLLNLELGILFQAIDIPSIYATRVTQFSAHLNI